MRSTSIVILSMFVVAVAGCAEKPIPQAKAAPPEPAAQAAVAAKEPIPQAAAPVEEPAPQAEVAVEAPPAPVLVPATGPPIPQDIAPTEKHRKARLEWNRQTLGGAYEKAGKKDPKWDQKAREAMELAAKTFSLQVDPVVTTAELHAAAKAAVDAGCDDPMLLYLFNRTAFGVDYPGEAESDRRMTATAKALAASEYPAFRRAATGRHVRGVGQEPDGRRQEASLRAL
jgi:hypothetical protein